MKINPDLKLRTIADESIILLQGNGTADYTKVLALNPTSKYLWEVLSGKEDFSADDVVAALLEQYEVEESKAREDALDWIKKLSELKVII